MLETTVGLSILAVLAFVVAWLVWERSRLIAAGAIFVGTFMAVIALIIAFIAGLIWLLKGLPFILLAVGLWLLWRRVHEGDVR